MILIINFILLYFIIMLIYVYNKQKKKFLGFRNWYQYFSSLFFIIFFIIFFVFFIRLLNLFREHKVIDLKFFFFNYNFLFLFLIIIFLIFLRRFLIFFAKISFLKLHYFYLSPGNNKYHIYYYKFYILYVYNSCVKSYKYFYFFDKVLFLILIFLVARDLLDFDFVLIDSLYFLSYYSFFKLIYTMLRFVGLKQKLMLDYFIFNLCYIGGVSLDEGYFAENLSKKAEAINDYETNVIKV